MENSCEGELLPCSNMKNNLDTPKKVRTKSKNLLIISSYPGKGETHGLNVVGVASYAKNTVKAISQVYKNEKLHVTVLAEKSDHENNYYEEGVEVKRIWKRNSSTIFPTLIKEVFKNHKKTDNILVEFEHAMFGDLFYVTPLPIFLLILKLLGKNVSVVFHQVVSDTRDLSGHINVGSNGFYPIFLNVLIHIFYTIILLLSNRVIVFEKALKDKLDKFGSSKKIIVIPHGVEKRLEKMGKREAKRGLGIKDNDFVILAFGYLAWYKGTDWLVAEISKMKSLKSFSNIKLVLAGGPNPNHLGKPYYDKYISSIERVCKENNVMLTGFVPEEEISTYYIASDLIVFPYRAMMSSSGPLSIAYTYEKPFIVSSALKDLLKSEDIEKSLDKFKIKKEKLFFANNEDFAATVKKIQKDGNYKKKLIKLSSDIGKRRNWDDIGKKYLEVI